MKNITVIVAGTGQHHDLAIEPGTTASDILRQINLAGYRLTRNNGQFAIDPNENLYPILTDGEKLAATAKTDVGNNGDTATPPQVVVVQRSKSAEEGQGGLIRPASSQSFPIIVRHRSLVQRIFRPFLEERGWQKRGDSFFGYYRTPFGAYSGRIVTRQFGGNSFYIKNPPNCLWSSPHAACFRQKGNDGYEVHFSQRGNTLDDGILAVERILREAHERDASTR